MNPKKNTMRYKSIRSLLAIAAVCLLASACSKEKPPIAEIRVIGSWVFPPNAGLGVFNLTGKKLVINMEHTALMNDIFFRNWKMDGYDLIFTNFNSDRQTIEQLHYTINTITDSTMDLTGRYSYIVGDSVHVVADLSGLYIKEKPQIPTPTPEQ